MVSTYLSSSICMLFGQFAFCIQVDKVLIKASLQIMVSLNIIFFFIFQAIKSYYKRSQDVNVHDFFFDIKYVNLDDEMLQSVMLMFFLSNRFKESRLILILM